MTNYLDAEKPQTLPELVDRSLTLIYLKEAESEEVLLSIYKDALEATQNTEFTGRYFYDFYGSLQTSDNVPNLMLDLSHPYSHFLRSF